MSGTLSSWSRRRAAVAAEAAAEVAATDEAAQAQEQAAFAEMSDSEILEELGLPDPQTLVQGDDFKAFMAKSVPQHLRKRALRTLWRSNPMLACVDGLNDYDDDYLTQGLNQGVIKTAYQVGKGMLAHLEEVERAKDMALQAIEDIVAEEDEVIAEQSMSEPEEEEPMVEPEIEQEPPVYTPRRMQFQFKDATA